MDISHSIEHAITNYFSQWLSQHPYLGWSIAHPLPSLGLLLLAIFTLSRLIKAIGWGIDRIWLLILKTPFKLLQPVFGLIGSSIWRIFGHNSTNAPHPIVKSTQIPPPERVEMIVDRLQILNQEQENLLQELGKLMSITSVKSNPKSTSDTQYENL
jgi:hypothetical protein